MSEKEKSTNVNNRSMTLKTVKVADLKQHPLYKKVYSEDDVEIKDLASNIVMYGLRIDPIVNSDLEILCGNRRIKALKLQNQTEVRVVELEISKEEEGEYIIGDNSERPKSFIEESNEVMVLFSIHSKRQGKDADGEHANKRINAITGYSTDKIAKIKNINEQRPSLLKEVDNGKKSLHTADQDAKAVKFSKEVCKLLDREYSAPDESKDINLEFKDVMMDLCETKGKKEYVDMLDKGGITPTQAFKEVVKGKPKSQPRESDEGSDELDICTCPLCGGEVTDEKIIKKLNQGSDKIIKLNEELENAA